MSIISHICRLLLVWFCLPILPLFAGGPLRLWDGKPILWPETARPIVFNVDQGALGPIPAQEAVQRVQSAFQLWQNVPLASIAFVRGGDISEDVNGSNFRRFLDGAAPELNPIVFDNDGAIFRALFGSGADDDYLGFASSVRTSASHEILSAQAVFNGKYISQGFLNPDGFQATLVHEFGHFIGLDHSQQLRHLAYNGVGRDDRYVPMMLPSAADDETVRDRLTDDDIAALENLYPAPELERQTGSITGRIGRGAQELPGVNVIARRVGSVTDQIYSTVSGTYESMKGTYALRGLPPGVYQVWIEPVDPYFYQASSVGQYAKFTSDHSFQGQPNARFWSSSAQGARSSWSPVTVYAGQTTADINFMVDASSYDRNEVDGQILALNHPEVGAVSANEPILFEYLLIPSSVSKQIVLTVQTDDSNAVFELRIGKGHRVRDEDPMALSLNGKARAILGDAGMIPLAQEPYFISVRNTGPSEFSFTVSARGEDGISPDALPGEDTSVPEWRAHSGFIPSFDSP